MARLLPADAAPPANPTAARLEALLASLPDEWTLIPDRCIGGQDGPRVGFVLLHPEIGIALVDIAPAWPEAGIRPLRGLLAEQNLKASDLPVVAVAIDADELESVGQRLATAFDAAPACGVEDRYWPERVAGLMLAAEDAAMAPIGSPAPPQADEKAERDWRPYVDPEDAVAAPPRPPHRTRLALAVTVVAVTLVGLGLGAVIDRLTRSPPPYETAATGITPEPPAASLPPSPGDLSASSAPRPAAAASEAPALPLPPLPKPQAPERPAVAEAPPPAQPKPALPAPIANPPAEAPAPPPIPTVVNASPRPVPPAVPPAVAASPKVSPPTAAERPAARVVASPPPTPAKSPAPAAQTRPATVKSTPKQLNFPPVKSAAAKPAPVRAPPDQTDGPPIDAADLPPLEDASRRTPPEPVRQIATLPPGAPVPLPTPYGGPPAPGQPIMLLPPVAPPAAMPPAPGLGTGGGGIASDPGRY